MTHLYSLLQRKVEKWRGADYPLSDYPALAEIFDYARLPETGLLRFLRPPQLRALETYWYLRLVEGTPHITELYARHFPKTSERLAALGLGHPDLRDVVLDEGLDGLLDQIKRDDALVKEYRLEAVRETLALPYPSYILALAMGAGKTMLIGAIIATEFAMALEYPDGPFVQNALVFAPGKTILEALRELAEVPYEQILPPRLYRRFVARYKLTFTRDGEKDLSIVRGSLFNIVVTNTEKIRIQKRPVRKRKGWTQHKLKELEEREEEIANLRLQAVASLPNLAVFSDEAHHTYGQAMEKDLKRVRQTVNYLHENTNLICVVNTTGTPYYKRQLLRDVVVWHGLSQGIRDGILKDVSDSVYAYRFDDASTDAFVAEVVRDFFTHYGKVRLPNGSPARIALYFPQENDLQAMRPVVERTLAELGYTPTIVLRNTSKSTQEEIDAFNRLNDPASPHRVILLVNKGTEGWNCPSLFATALARKLRSSNNFVLQAATRCLRQVPGNTHKARIYLSQDNYRTLDNQLQETYGEHLSDLNWTSGRSRRARIVVRKVDLPPLVVRRLVQTVVAKEVIQEAILSLVRPEMAETEQLIREQATLTASPTEDAPQRQVLQFVGREVIADVDDEVDLYTAATQLAAIYRLDVWEVYRELRRVYAGQRTLPEAHLADLARQIEEQTRGYEVRSETVEDALALVRLEGFEAETGEDGEVVYTATISYPIERERLLTHYEAFKSGDGRDFGFHYTPYNFDSKPEQNFFIWLLARLNEDPDDVEDIYFTGGLTPDRQTDFFIEYKGLDGRWHRYVPDFLIRKKDGRCLIVEIKDARWESPVKNDLALAGEGQEGVSVEGRKVIALNRWTNLDPERLAYHVIYTATEVIPTEDLAGVQEFLYAEDAGSEA